MCFCVFFFFPFFSEHLEEWKKGRDMSLEQQAQHVTSFQEQAQALMEGLSDMQTLLEEKEFQLWEKEGLLEYQEERLMNSEDLELEMANYINESPSQALGAHKGNHEHNRNATREIFKIATRVKWSDLAQPHGDESSTSGFDMSAMTCP